MKIIFDAPRKAFSSADKAKKFTPTRVLGDGWDAKINPDGSVTCTAKEMRDGKYAEICLKINTKGIVTITQLINGRREQISRFRTKNWPFVGIITLTKGPVEEKKAFFYNIETI